MFELAGLFAVDSLGGGFIVQGLLSYWFYIRYQVATESLGLLFFATNALGAVSFFLSPYIARRIGLLRTMVFTHLPCSLMLLLIPLMPTYELAAAILILRSLLSSMDIPTRQAYTMLLVSPEERAAAAGLTNSARSVAQSLAPVLSGVSLSTAAIGLPFFLAGTLKSSYDLAVYFRFRHVRLPDSR